MNSGSTPARNVKGRFRIFPSHENKFADFSPNNARMLTCNNIGPGLDTDFEFVSETLLSLQDSEELHRWQKTIYVVGEITYLDVFGNLWRTPFRLKRVAGTANPLGEIEPCSEGNEGT